MSESKQLLMQLPVVDAPPPSLNPDAAKFYPKACVPSMAHCLSDAFFEALSRAVYLDVELALQSNIPKLLDMSTKGVQESSQILLGEVIPFATTLKQQLKELKAIVAMGRVEKIQAFQGSVQ